MLLHLSDCSNDLSEIITASASFRSRCPTFDKKLNPPSDSKGGSSGTAVRTLRSRTQYLLF